MKKTSSLLMVSAFAAFAIIVSTCGNQAAKEKARLDSIRVADSIATVQATAKRIADSIAALPKPIATLAAATPILSTLTAALQAAELAEALNGTDAFTVFAPANDAFAAIQSTVDNLLKPENKSKLQNVLKYHVVAGTVKAADLKNGDNLVTLQGEKLRVSVKDGKVTVGGSEVTQADVAASNGVVHIVNKVLVPRKM
jgi:uncharacterized surface protein with fasciclin (FAS1) repeats